MSNSDESHFTKKLSPVPVSECGMALAAELLMERWSMLIIREAFYGVKRFDDIREDTGIPRSVLTDRLKKLVDIGILERKPYKAEGARSRNGYILSEKGKELALTILSLMQWGDKYLKDGKAAIEISSKVNGRNLKVALVEKGVKETQLSDINLRVLL